jgi:hypothetical protein
MEGSKPVHNEVTVVRSIEWMTLSAGVRVNKSTFWIMDGAPGGMSEQGDVFRLGAAINRELRIEGYHR